MTYLEHESSIFKLDYPYKFLKELNTNLQIKDCKQIYVIQSANKTYNDLSLIAIRLEQKNLRIRT